MSIFYLVLLQQVLHMQTTQGPAIGLALALSRFLRLRRPRFRTLRQQVLHMWSTPGPGLGLALALNRFLRLHRI